MKNIKIINWFCLSGVIGLIFYILHDVVGAFHYPDYNWISQAVSDLTSETAPSFIIAGKLSSLFHIFNCLCVAMVCTMIQGKGNKLLRSGIYLFTLMTFISAVGYSFFPLSESGFAGAFQDIMHAVVTVFVVGLSIISLVLIAIACLKNKTNKSLGVFALVFLGLMFIGSVGVRVVPLAYFGIPERFAVYSAVTYTAVLGIYGFRSFNWKTPSENELSSSV